MKSLVTINKVGSSLDAEYVALIQRVVDAYYAPMNEDANHEAREVIEKQVKGLLSAVEGERYNDVKQLIVMFSHLESTMGAIVTLITRVVEANEMRARFN